MKILIRALIVLLCFVIIGEIVYYAYLRQNIQTNQSPAQSQTPQPASSPTNSAYVYLNNNVGFETATATLTLRGTILELKRDINLTIIMELVNSPKPDEKTTMIFNPQQMAKMKLTDSSGVDKPFDGNDLSIGDTIRVTMDLNLLGQGYEQINEMHIEKL